jgi:hypothetical protein
VTKLARTSFLGMAPEAVAGTYLAPTFAVPFLKASYETVQAPLRDESVRGNDAVLQGLFPGPSESTWDMSFNAYPDSIGSFLRVIGPDTVTAATSTTLSSGSIVGATSISTAATIPLGSTIKIGTGAAAEYAITGTPSGAGPFTIPITSPATGLTKIHSASDPVITTTKHTFAQSSSTRPPSFSISVYDNIDYRGWAGCKISELAVKIDPKGVITLNPKFVGFPEAVVASFVPTWTNLQPLLGWGWTQSMAGGPSTRGITLDLTAKRATEAIHSSDGLQGPREVFNGALELDGSYKAIYEAATDDMALFLAYTQTPITATLTKALPFGGESLAITMSQGGVPKAVRDLSQTYVQATYDVSAIYNSTDGGIATATLQNFTTTAY